jgi:hypothetical protein
MDTTQTQANVARAIKRSRQSRAAMRSRRRRSAILVGLIAASLGGAAIWSIGAATGNDMMQAAVRQANSLADLLGGRSPGRRTMEELSKTKQARSLAKLRPGAKPAPVRHEAAAPRIAMVDLDKLLESPAAVPLGPEAPSTPPLETAPPSIVAYVAPPPSGISPGGSPGTTPGGTPGGSSPPIVFSAPKVVVPVPSAVPEPGTWAMLLLGFALVGLQVRQSGRGAIKPVQLGR